MDYENVHVLVLFGLAKLILSDPATASRYGITRDGRDSLLADVLADLKYGIREGSNGANASLYPGIKVDAPYHTVFASTDWGFNRYNLGMVNKILMYYDLTRDRAYGEVGMDNINYLLGANPFDLSFIMGCGDRNLQHPHYRAANPEGYNQGGEAYPYRVPVGAVMGGANPKKPLLDHWKDYTSTEVCIDYAAQAVFPLLILSQGGGGGVSIGGKSTRTHPPSLREGRKQTRDLLGRKVIRAKEAESSPARFLKIFSWK